MEARCWMVILVFLFLKLQFSAHSEGRNQLRPFAHYSECSLSKSLFRPDEQQKIDLGVSRGVYELFIYDCSHEKIRAIILGDRVRSHKQVIAISDKNEIEIIEWNEPEKYRPATLWLDRFKKLKLTEIDGLTGATLSAESTKGLVQRAQKIFRWQK